MARLNRNIKYKLNSYFLNVLGFITYKNGWLKGDCPDCGAEFKYGVHLSDNRTNCFVCGYNKKPITVVGNIESLRTEPEILNFLGTLDDIAFREVAQTPVSIKEVDLPESYKLILLGSSQISKLARNTLTNRGFSILDLALKGVGYCTKGDYKNRIIFPFYEGGKLVYFNARRILNDGTPKFKNPDKEKVGFGKSILIYNINALYTYNRVYLVESVTNALTMGDNGVSVGGKVVSNYQLSTILASPVKTVIILLDPDAWEYAIDTALKLCLYKKVKVVRLPDSTDVNDIGKKATLKLVKESEYVNYKNAFKLKLNQ